MKSSSLSFARSRVHKRTYYDFALGEGIAGVPRWACADGIVVDHLAQTVNAARSGARIDTFLVDTRSV
jgi:hypothetical protein